MEIKEISNFLKTSETLIPDTIKISNLHWKLICYSVLKGKNLLIKGASGSGKTKTVYALQKVFKDRPFFPIEFGNIRNPEVKLIGKTHLDTKTGTFFNTSYFIKAIQTENAIILLDELSRSHKDAWNILMSVLDPNQRFLRIDDEINTPIIKVAKGVCFIATANVGRQYTATNTLDHAFEERFKYFEMDILNKKQEIELQSTLFPNINKRIINDIVDIAITTRNYYKDEDHELNYYITTKQIIEFLEQIECDFSFKESAETEIFYRVKNKEDLNLIKQIFDKYESI